MSKRYWTFLLGIALICACTQDRMPELIGLDLELQALIDRAPVENNDGMNFYVLPDGSDLSKIPQDLENNPLNEAKVELGKFLFFETGFATQAIKTEGMGTFSCASCHIPEAGFKSNTRQGIADGGRGFGLNGETRRRSDEYDIPQLDVQSARPLSLVNVGFVKNTTWNGRFGAEDENTGTEEYWIEADGTSDNALGFKAIETQNFKGLETHRILVTKDLIDQFGYTDLFDEAFPELTDDQKYSNFGGSLAISAYIRTVISNKAPFQQWLKGDRSALSLEEKNGALLFFGKANCSKCHYNENLGSGELHALGVKDIDDGPFFRTTESELQDRNLGRGAFTGLDEDLYKFKVPGLYNSGDADHFFHGASALTLEDVIQYKNSAVTENDQVDQSRISDKFLPLNLTEQEQQQLVLFLRKSLRDPDLLRYKPTSIKSGQCYPNNDSESRLDLGCN